MKDKILKILSPEIDIYDLSDAKKEWIADDIHALRYEIAQEVIREALDKHAFLMGFHHRCDMSYPDVMEAINKLEQQEE